MVTIVILILSVVFVGLYITLAKQEKSRVELRLFVALYALGFVQWVSLAMGRPLNPARWIAAGFELIGLAS